MPSADVSEPEIGGDKGSYWLGECGGGDDAPERGKFRLVGEEGG